MVNGSSKAVDCFSNSCNLQKHFCFCKCKIIFEGEQTVKFEIEFSDTALATFN